MHIFATVTPMPDFLEEKKREIDGRLNELRPLVEEFHRLEAASAALSGVPASGSRTKAPAHKRAASAKPAGTAKRGRPKGSGQRAKEALDLVRAQPGITIPDLATAMGIKQNYLYRVMPQLQKDGMIRKQGRGWHAKDAA
jgi:CRP-like cAMP-binding protein